MQAICFFVIILARVLNIAILAHVLLSWIPLDRDNQLVRLIYEITEPILGPIRRVIPPFGGLDLSPMFGLILVEIVERVLLSILPC
ncbi:MAG: YggT family protein [Chloroflexota bacterium]|nr:YggT family protein [Chloroflexota bacterium]